MCARTQRIYLSNVNQKMLVSKENKRGAEWWEQK